MLWFSTRRSQEDRDRENRLEKLEHEIKQLRWEWDDAYDKLRTLTARFTKRAQQIEKHEQPEQPANGSLSGAGTATSMSASPMLDPMSKRILERRARLFAGQRKEESA